MKILLLGATGTFGSSFAKRLIADTDYHLTLFSRHASEKYKESDKITVIDGDAMKVADLKVAVYGHNAVYCAISGDELPAVAENIVSAMKVNGVNRLIFMGAVGIYNEIPDEMDGKDNVCNNPEQIPNKQAVDIIEASDLNYTVLRPGYLQDGDENDFVLTVKGEPARGYITTISSVEAFALKLLADETLYSRTSVSITKNMKNL